MWYTLVLTEFMRDRYRNRSLKNIMAVVDNEAGGWDSKSVWNASIQPNKRIWSDSCKRATCAKSQRMSGNVHFLIFPPISTWLCWEQPFSKLLLCIPRLTIFHKWIPETCWADQCPSLGFFNIGPSETRELSAALFSAFCQTKTTIITLTLHWHT